MTRALALKEDPPVDLNAIYDQDGEQLRLGEIMDRAYSRVLRAVHQVVAEAFPDVQGFRLEDSATNRILQDAATRVVRIDETTRQAIASMLQEGQQMGLSNWALANGDAASGFPGIDGLFQERWSGRALTVARTELAHAQLVSAEDRYMATGLVDRLQIIDGDDDAPCAARNGKIVPIETRPRLLHPNCTVVTLPVLREGLT